MVGLGLKVVSDRIKPLALSLAFGYISSLRGRFNPIYRRKSRVVLCQMKKLKVFTREPSTR